MKQNYQNILEEELKNLSGKPTLLLHSCCAPCSSYVLTYLMNYFDITVFYYNPNIYPYEEFNKRLNEQIKLINELNEEQIKLIKGTYDEEKFNGIIKGLEEENEGGKRCRKCYYFRLEETAKMALDNNFDYFTTTLSVSPYKNSELLNEIGKELGEKYNIKYLFSDFKKKEGYKTSIELSKKYNLYRQDYCGCKYSIAKIISE